jgi:hypothetical protein
MAEQTQPIPHKLSQAFRDVVVRYADWSPSASEITMRIDEQNISMSDVCVLMEAFADPLPDDLLDRLLSHLLGYPFGELNGKLRADPTHRTGGYCLLKLVEYRKTIHKYRQDERRHRR